jgi:hypothetical protein
MFETIYLPSDRVIKGVVITNAGIARFRNNPGIVRQYPTLAYKSGITKVQDNVQTSQPAVIAAAAPFSIPIRNASYNLNADPNALYRTPRSGLLWRVVGKEGDDVDNSPRKKAKTIPIGIPTQLTTSSEYYHIASDFIGKLWDKWYRASEDDFANRNPNEPNVARLKYRIYLPPSRGEVMYRTAIVFHTIPKEGLDVSLYKKLNMQALEQMEAPVREYLRVKTLSLWNSTDSDRENDKIMAKQMAQYLSKIPPVHDKLLMDYYKAAEQMQKTVEFS